MPKASVLTIRLPTDLKQRIALIAEAQGVSINQLAMYLLTKKLAIRKPAKRFQPIGTMTRKKKSCQVLTTSWQRYARDLSLIGIT